MELIKKE